MNKSVSVVGSINYDITLESPRLPEKGETFVASSVSYTPGGKGLNQAVQLSRLGIETKFFGCIGRDIFGDFILKNVNDKLLDFSKIKYTKSHTGISVANVLEDGTVASTIYPGANFDVNTDYILENMPNILNAEYIILQLEIPVNVVETIIAKAKEHKTKVILNAAPARDISDQALKDVDTLIVNEVEAKFYLGKTIENVEDALKYGREYAQETGINLIITLGKIGSVFITKDDYGIIDPVKPEIVKDSMGAGDSYIGAFTFARVNGARFKEACNFASYIASRTVTKFGTQEAMPTIKEVHDDPKVKAGLYS